MDGEICTLCPSCQEWDLPLQVHFLEAYQGNFLDFWYRVARLSCAHTVTV